MNNKSDGCKTIVAQRLANKQKFLLNKVESKEKLSTDLFGSLERNLSGQNACC